MIKMIIMILGTWYNSCHPTKSRFILRARRCLNVILHFIYFWIRNNVVELCVLAIFFKDERLYDIVWDCYT